MASELTFFTNPMSRGRIVRWMLEEIGAPYETVIVKYGDEMKSAEYLAINPMGKVPALRHGETVVTECGAICAYLADAFPDAGLAPALGDPARGSYYRWMFFGAGPVDQAATAKACGWTAPADRAGMVGFGAPGDVATALETAIENGPYILGERFSAADVYVGSLISWGVNFETLEQRPAFRPYVERLQARPAALRANEKDDALMPNEP